MVGTKNTQPVNTKPSSNSLEDAYMPGDPIPVPEAIETDTDSAWAMWQDSTQEPKTTTFDETVPMRLEDTPPTGTPQGKGHR